ncbi:MAG: acylneuraminate cytidylyltransferase family protein [Anaerolineales bacterium]|nr:acylneuraminate cytidylyltransferase family protein [Anaerolineales bacterium]
MSELEIVALVPMRHHSQRVPGKNYRLLNGRPLYAYILDSLLQSGAVSRIVVDTDSPEIRRGIGEAFPEVTLLDRPPELRDGSISMNRVLLHDAAAIPAPFYLQTHSTNPLLSAGSIAAAVRAFRQALPQHDSLFSVTRWQKRLWDAAGNPVNHDPAVLLNTQDLPPVYEENSCLYLFEREGFLRRKNRIGEHPLLFEIPAREALDIDDEEEFRLVEGLLAGRG